MSVYEEAVRTIEQEVAYVSMRANEYDLLGTQRCPYQFVCEAVNAPNRFMSEFAARMADEALILAEMLLKARGEELTHDTLNAAIAEAHGRWVANLRAMEGGEKLPGCVLDVMNEHREAGGAA